MQIGPLIGSGRSADVFAIDDAWVLRRYREGGDASAEASVMRYLSNRGYPVPRVRRNAGKELIMERLSGPTLAEALRQGTLSPQEAGEVLARLLHRLHALPARVSNDPANRILHLDLHPENVMLTAAGPMVIDWTNTTEGAPALDRGMTALILAEVAVGPRLEAPAAHAVLVSLLARVERPIDLAGALAIRHADTALSQDEKRLLRDAMALADSIRSGDDDPGRSRT